MSVSTSLVATVVWEGHVIDFGTIPTETAAVTVAHLGCTPERSVLVVPDGAAPPGRSSDENEMDPIHYSATAGTDSFVVYATALRGPVVGSYRFLYALD
jgi:hypothetical protein